MLKGNGAFAFGPVDLYERAFESSHNIEVRIADLNGDLEPELLITDGHSFGFGRFLVLQNRGTAVVGVPAPSASRLALELGTNPIATGAEVWFAVPREGHARLDLFDVSGRRISTLFDETAAPGRNSLRWSGRSGAGTPLPAGAFVLRLTHETSTTSLKVVRLGR